MYNMNYNQNVVDTSIPPPNFLPGHGQFNSAAASPYLPSTSNYSQSSSAPIGWENTFSNSSNTAGTQIPVNYSNNLQTTPNYQSMWRNNVATNTGNIMGVQNYNQFPINNYNQNQQSINRNNIQFQTSSFHNNQVNQIPNSIVKTEMPNLKIFNNPDLIFNLGNNNFSNKQGSARNNLFGSNVNMQQSVSPVNRQSIRNFQNKPLVNNGKNKVSSQNLISVPFFNNGENIKDENLGTEDNFNGHTSFCSTSSNSSNGNSVKSFHVWDCNQDNANHSKHPWMSESIQNNLKKRNALFAVARKTNDPAAWNEYNTLKHQIDADIREAKNKATNRGRRFNDNVKIFNPRNDRSKSKVLPFSCDTCDRSYATENEYKEHCTLHKTCEYEGCSFSAHPKIVDLHQRMQHETGYADAINKLQNAEEIKKWREERKKRFPTAENIAKRKAEQAEKEARGEVVEDKQFGKFKKPGERKYTENKRFNRRDRNSRHQRRGRYAFNRFADYKPEGSDSINSDSEEEECHIKLPIFPGMKKELDIVSFEIPDVIKEETNEASPVEKQNDKSLEKSENLANVEEVSKGLAEDFATEQVSKQTLNESENFVNEEDNFKESDDDGPIEIPISKVPVEENHALLNGFENLDGNESNDEGPVEIPISKVPVEENSEMLNSENFVSSNLDGNESITEALDNKSNSEEKSQDKMNKDNNHKKRKRENDNPKNQPHPKIFKRRKNSLLEMLMAGDIRHERNVIMQCIRHIVRNNYFGAEKNNCDVKQSELINET